MTTHARPRTLRRHFCSSIAGFLGSYYLLLAVMNGVAAFLLWQSGRTDARCFACRSSICRSPRRSCWLLVSLVFLLIVAAGL